MSIITDSEQTIQSPVYKGKKKQIREYARKNLEGNHRQIFTVRTKNGRDAYKSYRKLHGVEVSVRKYKFDGLPWLRKASSGRKVFFMGPIIADAPSFSLAWISTASASIAV